MVNEINGYLQIKGLNINSLLKNVHAAVKSILAKPELRYYNSIGAAMTVPYAVLRHAIKDSAGCSNELF